MIAIAIDSDRLWESLEEISQFGATEAGGLNRLAASVADGQARDYFVQVARSIGCSVRIDALGNVFVRREGTDPSAKGILIGSHLDSQPFGGKYDGIYGVMAGLEVLRTLHQHDVELTQSIDVVCWTNEEGARFAPAMMGAAFFAGKFTTDELHARVDVDGVTLGDSLRAINYLGGDVLSPADYAQYLEIHIEQGPLLEQRGLPIGVVSGVQAMRWHRIYLDGTSGHSGTYPMEIRRDALVAASQIIARVNEIGLARPEIGRATVGFIEVHPNSPNVIPGQVELMVEFRHPEQAEIARMSAELLDALEKISTDSGVEAATTIELDAAPVVFDSTLVELIETVCSDIGVSYQKMLSGAGHDAVQLSGVVPSAMIFIPCVDGISHAENETITQEWAAQGAQVLLDTVLAL